MKAFFYSLLLFVSAIWAQITEPSSTTVWVNGQTGQITWSGLYGTSYTIVLTRTGTVYHHTIVSYTANTGSYAWIVDIPSQDGWPASTSAQQVYEIDFYVNGGWNNGGQLAARSQQFAIEYNEGSATDSVVTGIVTQATTLTSNGGGGGYGTSTQTVVVVGVTTFTTVLTAVYPLASPGQMQTVTVNQPVVITSTITNLNELSTTAGLTTVYTGATTNGGPPGATTIGGNTVAGGAKTTSQALISGANGKFNREFKLVAVVSFIVGVLLLVL